MNTLKEVISKFAPVLGTALGGPVGGSIVAMIANAFNTDEKDPEKLANIISNDPQAEIKILELKAGLANAYLLDVQNARQREIEIAKNGEHDWVLPSISLSVILGFFMVIGIIMFTPLDKSDHDVLYLLVGTLGAAFTQVLNYYLGTSFGEQKQIKFPDLKK